jgi:superfamily II DNA helicase RecQ
LSEEEFDRALEKLEIHGGARVDFGGNVTLGGTGWKNSYTIQAQFRAEQFEKVLRFTTSSECRMAALVRHFGDVADASRSCGICDVCDPAGAVLRLFRRASARERELAQAIADELRGVSGKATGTLQRNLEPVGHLNRNDFEGLLDAMVRAGLIEIEDAEFEKNGEVIRFRKVLLTAAGLELRAGTPLNLLIGDGIPEEFGGRTTASGRAKKAPAKSHGSAKPSAKTSSAGAAGASAPTPLTAAQEALAARLKAWRTAEAKKLGVPAFVVLHDRTLTALAAASPKNTRELLEVDGMGPAKTDKFGEAILGLCSGAALLAAEL